MLWITVSACSLKEPKGLCWYRPRNLSICNQPVAWGDHRIRCRPRNRLQVIGVCKSQPCWKMAHSLSLWWWRPWSMGQPVIHVVSGWFDSVSCAPTVVCWELPTTAWTPSTFCQSLDTVKICVAYDGERWLPSNEQQTLQTNLWRITRLVEDITIVRHLDQRHARNYVRRIGGWLCAHFNLLQSDQSLTRPISWKVSGQVNNSIKSWVSFESRKRGL